jgi:hypothetical protein
MAHELVEMDRLNSMFGECFGAVREWRGIDVVHTDPLRLVRETWEMRLREKTP